MNLFRVSTRIWIARAIALCIAVFPSSVFARGGKEPKDYRFSLKVSDHTGDADAKFMDQTIATLKRRLNGTSGRIKYEIGKGQKRRISLSVFRIPADRLRRIRVLLERRGNLEFREVSLRSDEMDSEGVSLAQRVLDGSDFLLGYKAFTLESVNAEGVIAKLPLLLDREVAISSVDVDLAIPYPQQAGAVVITLSEDGAKKMAEFTARVKPFQIRIGIVFDGKLVRAPTLTHAPLGENFLIEGLDEIEVNDLALLLMNPLKHGLQIEEMKELKSLPPDP